MGLLDTLGPVLGMQPTPQPPQPPSDLMQQLMSLGSVDQRHKLLQSQFDMGGQLAQGAPVDYSHGKGTPLLLSGLANLFSAGMGGYQQGKATGGLRDLVTQTDAGLKAGVDLGSQWKPPDIAGVQTATDADLPAKTQAAQDSIGTGRRFAMAIAASGNPQLAAIGKSIMSQADEGQQALQGMPRTRNELQMSGLDIAKRLRGAAVETSPVVGGARALFLKKMGYPVPDGASPEELAALVPEAEKAFELETKRSEAPKVTVVPPGSSVVDRSGKPLASAGAAGGDLISQTADGIEKGIAPPDMKGLGRLRVPVQAELAKRGFNLSQANLDWQATQKHLATLNSGGQERLNQAINFVSDTIPVIRHLYNDWQQEAGSSGFKLLNKATLATMKQLPGKAGATAQALETQINDFVSELGTVYKGGGTSTDKSLGMAASNLAADWNPETFNAALNLAEKNIAIRKNSVASSQVHGASGGNPYAPPSATAAPAVVEPQKATHRFNPATGKIEAVP